LQAVFSIARELPEAAGFLDKYGDDQKQPAAAAARALGDRYAHLKSAGDIPPSERSAVRNDFNRVDAELMKSGEAKGMADADKKRIKAIHADLAKPTQYAPWWVRILSALCLGIGTMVGYKRIVKTLGERLGKTHLVPAQGAAAELVAAGLIGFAGFSGYPVSTTHVVTGGIAGTMVASGAGVQTATVWQIVAAWLLTLPATIVISGGLFYLLS
jgi:PiT family inorganic phosphate transporter